MFIENRIQHVKETLIADFREVEDEVNERIKEREVELNLILEKILSDITAEREGLLFKIRQLTIGRDFKAQSIVKFDPKVFKKACPPDAVMCEHFRAKYWGNEYGNGVRCLNCGKELSRM